MKKRIAFINQRYGLEVNGGSEFYTRLIAERLKEKYDLEVITTTAVDHANWDNYYSPGLHHINGVDVRRFRVDHRRSDERFGKLHHRVFGQQQGGITKALEMKWAAELGPLSTQMIRYLGKHLHDYDAFIVVTYLYYPAIKSLPIVGDKAIFIPTAHEESYIHLKIFEDLFKMPKSFIFLTDEEKQLVHKLFRVEDKPFDVLGVGVDVPQGVSAELFCEQHGVDDYIIYVGRIESGKGCVEMLSHFIEFKSRNPSGLKLVLVGKSSIPIPDHPDIVSLGFVSEEEKFSALAGAKALIQPSQFESLSIVLLEAMTLSVPVIVNAKCEVLKGHCLKSNAGLYYEDFLEFEGALNYMLSHEREYAQMKRNAKRYVDENYQWDTIISRFEKMIELVASSSRQTRQGALLGK